MARSKVTDDATAAAPAAADATAAADSAATTADNAAAAVRQACKEYDPEADPRLWRRIAEMWRGAAHEFVEITTNLMREGRSADVIPRLVRALKERQTQEPGEITAAVEEFRRTATEYFATHQHDAMAGEVFAQIQTNERMKAEARLKAEAREAERREQQARQLERQAEALRQGPPRPASFIEIPALG